MEQHITHLKKHRNVLYALIFLLLVMNVCSLVVLTSQNSKIISQQLAMEERFSGEIGDLRRETRADINEVTRVISVQKEDFESQINLLKSSQNDFSGIIEEVVKGVVSISTDRAAGSGFIVDPAGYVVTNYHVIDEAGFYKITTSEGQVYDADLVGYDQPNDIALLKIPGVFHSLELTDSEDTTIGENVIAIGNPLGLSFSVTEGIVSAVHRAGPNGKNAYTQTDVTLNPGNSGGPLINKEGKVIGVNNFKIGGAESLGFALESNFVRDSVNLIANMTIIN